MKWNTYGNFADYFLCLVIFHFVKKLGNEGCSAAVLIFNFFNCHVTRTNWNV